MNEGSVITPSSRQITQPVKEKHEVFLLKHQLISYYYVAFADEYEHFYDVKQFLAQSIKK